MTLNVTLVGGKELVARLNALPEDTRKRLKNTVNALAIGLQNHIVQDKLSGQVLKVRSGALRRSIQRKTTVTETGVIGEVYSSGDVKYARIHEYGGTIKHPGGTAYIVVHAGGVGRAVFLKNNNPLAAHARRTKAHPIPMPERSFMRTGLADQADTIREKLRLAVAAQCMASVHGTTVA